MRSRASLAVYCDFKYRVDDGLVTAELPFSLFLLAISQHFSQLTLVGRLDSTGARFPYELRDIHFEPLPHYTSGAELHAVVRTLPSALRRFWRLMTDVDVVWILGPNPPHAIAFALLALIRRRRVVLGVRQQLPEVIRHRYPARPVLWRTASVLDQVFRLLGRALPVVVVGPQLGLRYRHARSLHVSLVSLIDESDVLRSADDRRDFDGSELRLLSVGRLDPEKNPLLLVNVLRDLVQIDPRWSLEVCGDGSMTEEMTRHADELGLTARITLHGHVPFGADLRRLYRHCHALLHVSLAEGVPQVLLEAFAARLPVVATAVGGVPAIVDGRGLLVGPANGPGAAAAVQRLIDDPALRSRCVEAAVAFASEHTLHAESEKVALFLRDPA